MTVTNAVNTTLYEKTADFSFMNDIVPVASTIRSANVLEVNLSVPAKTVPEFIAYAKANPGKLNYASFGTGTAPNMAAELFKMMTGTNLVHVPYRSSFMPDLFSGQVQVAFLADTADHRLHQSRQGARAGGHRRDAVGRAAGHSRRGAIRSGLRSQHLARHRCAQGHARGYRRKAPQRDQRRPQRSGDEAEVRQSRSRTVRR